MDGRTDGQTDNEPHQFQLTYKHFTFICVMMLLLLLLLQLLVLCCCYCKCNEQLLLFVA